MMPRPEMEAGASVGVSMGASTGAGVGVGLGALSGALVDGLSDGLSDGLAALGLTLLAQQEHQLLAYLALIAKWNKVYNLTAIRKPQQMLSHHLLDSLAVIAPLRRHLGDRLADHLGGCCGFDACASIPLSVPASVPELTPTPVLHSARLLDVGAGAGLPGVVIAICCPFIEVVCVDAVGKKAGFIQQVVLELGLANLRGVHARVEDLPASVAQEGFDVITSRAFASLGDCVVLTRRWLRPQTGVWMAMKAKSSEVSEEIFLMEQMAQTARLPSDVVVFHVEPVSVPSLAEERCLVWMGIKN